MECLNTHHLLQIPNSSLLAAAVFFSNQDKLKVVFVFLIFFLREAN